MFSSNSVALLAFLLHSLLLCLPVCSIPLDARQADNPPTEVSSVTTAVFPTATCVISSTKKKDGQGEDIIVEVEVCVAEKGALSSEGSSTRISSTSPSSTTPSSTSTTTITVTLPRTSSTSPPSTGTILPPSSASPPPSSTSPPPISTSSVSSSTSSPPSINSPLSSSASVPSISTSSPIPSPSSSIPFPVGAIGGPPLSGDADIPTTSTIPPPLTSLSVQPSAAGVSAAAESSMPGKKLSVLPIGLGVFAGISVIALIVVGLVTYERTKYRKAFRQRKLAEAGAPMGYGGSEY